MNKEITGKKKKITIISFIWIIVIALVVVIVLLVRNDDSNISTEEKNDSTNITEDVNKNNDSGNIESTTNNEITFDNVDDYVKYMKEQTKEDVLIIDNELQLATYDIFTRIDSNNKNSIALEFASCINSNACPINNSNISLLSDNDLIKLTLAYLKKKEMNSNYICYKKEIVDNIIKNFFGRQNVSGNNHSSTILNNYYCDFPGGGGSDFVYYDSKLEENQWVGYYRNNNNNNNIKTIKIIFESSYGDYRITKINTEIIDNE